MRKIKWLCILGGFILLFAAPLLAQQAADDTTAPEEVTTPDEETAAGGWADEGVVTGEVVSIDVAAATITVKSDDGTDKTFAVVEGETILWKGIEDIGLGDVPKGEKAEVGYYTDENGKLIASWVDVLVAEEATPSAETPAAPEGTTQDETLEE